MNIGDTVDTVTAARMLDAAAEAGITVLDTANGYAGSRCEQILGELLATRRGRVAVASKVGIPHPDGGDAPPLSHKAIRACVRGSLARLGLDRLDIHYLHQPDRATPFAETLAAIGELVADGTVGVLGVSNFAAWQIAELRRVAVETGGLVPTFSAGLFDIVYNPRTLYCSS